MRLSLEHLSASLLGQVIDHLSSPDSKYAKQRIAQAMRSFRAALKIDTSMFGSGFRSRCGLDETVRAGDGDVHRNVRWNNG